jgi:hypothetical protein
MPPAARLRGDAVSRPVSMLAVVAILGALTADVLPAQDRTRIQERCAQGASSPLACQEGALAAEALLGGVGLALSGGSELPGSPSTLGRRYGTSPRWAFSGRVGLVQFDLPGLTAEDPARARNVWVPTLQGQVAAGVFDGFRLAPTVGGFLSLDLVATGGVALLPGGEGFDGAAPALGYGVRVGLLRESFSLPAVTFAVTRRHVAGFRFRGDGEPGVEIEGLTVTSYRTTVGKEFVALGLLAGLGWDRASGDGVVRPPGAGLVGTTFEDVGAGRFLIFGALTRTWLIVQGTVEAGFASGWDDRPTGSPPAGAYDPTAGSFFGGLAFRLIY